MQYITTNSNGNASGLSLDGFLIKEPSKSKCLLWMAGNYRYLSANPMWDWLLTGPGHRAPWLLRRKLANKEMSWLHAGLSLRMSGFGLWIMRSFDIYGFNLFDKFHTHVINWLGSCSPTVVAINFDGLVRLWVASPKGLKGRCYPNRPNRVVETIRFGINCNNGYYYLFLFSNHSQRGCPCCLVLGSLCVRRRINFHKISMPGYW